MNTRSRKTPNKGNIMDAATILKAGTPIYVTDPGTAHTGSSARARRHVATVIRPMRDYGRNTASYYEVERWDGSYGVYSADYVEARHEGRDAAAFYACPNVVTN